MKSQIRKIGNSTGAIIPKKLLESLGINCDDEIEIFEENQRIVIEKVKKPLKYTLEELIAKCDPNAEIDEENKLWDSLPPHGKEKW